MAARHKAIPPMRKNPRITRPAVIVRRLPKKTSPLGCNFSRATPSFRYSPTAILTLIDALFSSCLSRGIGLPADFCVIHRQSNDRGKDWTAEGWLALCAMLKAQSGIAVVEVGAGSPERLPQPIDGVVNLVNRLSILETAEVIRRARLFIGVDSGPAHIANALEVPGIVLLGTYGFFRQYTPFTGFYTSKSPLVELVRNKLGPVADLSHDRVLDAVKYTLAATFDLSRTRAAPLSTPVVSWEHPVEPQSVAIASSGAFDIGWYAINHPEVLAAATHPIDHYVREGITKGYAPAPNMADEDIKEWSSIVRSGDGDAAASLERTRNFGGGRTDVDPPS